MKIADSQISNFDVYYDYNGTGKDLYVMKSMVTTDSAANTNYMTTFTFTHQ